MAEPDPLILADAEDTRAAGAGLAVAVRTVGPPGFVIYLEGDLGAGKTTMARGFLEALGHRGRVPSPTYTLIEPYTLCGYRVYHIDLYRIRQARELDDLDLSGQLTPGSLALIEWPDHGGGQLPPPDLRLTLDWVHAGRRLTCHAVSNSGREVLGNWWSLRRRSQEDSGS
jgi:tRNA threonylcarbamoyladenosine biosynthesis protein TsaE